jgi:phosphoglycerol transferase
MGLAKRRLGPDFVAAAGAMALAFLLAAIALDLWKADMHVPFDYGGDSNLNQIAIKGMIDHGWFQHNESLAAPFGQNMLDFPVFSGETLQFLIMKVIGIFTSDSAVVMNAFFLLGFPLAALTAFATLRALGIGRVGAVTAAVLFAIAPYHFLRGEFHLFIGTYYAVPLGVYLALTVMLGRPLPRWPWLVLLCLVIGSAHVYYAAFTLVLLAAALILRLIAEGRRGDLLAGLGCVALITVAVLANHLPNILYTHKHGSNPEIVRLPSESERYGLKLAQMILPVPDHRLEPLADLREQYRPAVDSVNEGDPQALGLIATLGLAWLFVVLLLGGVARIRAMTDELQVAAARLTAVAFVVGTVGGLSAIMAYLLTDQIRAWGRMSIVIAFLALIPLAALIDHGFRAWRVRSAWLVACGLVLLGFLDQTNGATPFDYKGTSADYGADRALVQAAEQRLPAGATVFELPLEPFPEPQPAYIASAISGYALGRPYLHSSDQRWSYGAMKGRADGWQRAVVGLPPAVLARAVASAGFAGLLVDRAGYADAGERVIGDVVRETGAQPVAAPNGRLVFFDLRGYASRLLAGRDSTERAGLRHAVLTPVTTSFGGFSRPRQSNEHVWRYLGAQTGEIALTNTDQRSRRVVFGVTLAAPPDRRVTARVSVPGQAAQTVELGNRGRRVSLPLTLSPGTTRIRIGSSGPSQTQRPDVALPYDLLVEDPVVTDAQIAALGSPPQSKLSSNAGSPFVD